MQKKITTSVLLLLLFFLTTNLFSQSVNIPGFGAVEYTQKGNLYTLNFKDFGKFDFRGTINPINLTSNVTIDDLSKVPGHVILEKMNVKNIELNLSSKGFIIQANAETSGALKTISEFLKIKDPTISILARIALKGFSIRGDLNFTEPLVLVLNEEMGTTLTYNKVSIITDVGIDFEIEKDEDAGSRSLSIDITPEISFVTDMLIKPSLFDPHLRTQTVLSYNLITQEIKGSGSIIDTWNNPFGIGEVFEGKTVMEMTNMAVSIGWIPGAPSPTNLGFYLENGKLFDLNFSVAMDFSPTSGKVGFRGSIVALSMNDFTRILREGFELDVPDIFPDDIRIENVEILFSPDGGRVGAFEIEQGFVIAGKLLFAKGFKGDLNFRTSEDEGVFLYMNMDADFNNQIRNAVSNNSLLRPIVNNLMNSYELKNIELKLVATKKGKLSGKTSVSAKVLQQDINFQFEGSFDGERIAKELINRITDVGLQNINLAEATRQVIQAASLAAENSTRIAENAFAQAQRLSKEAEVALNHIQHSPQYCYNTCVPNHANKQVHTMLEGSNRAVRAFQDDILQHLINNAIGQTPQETQQMRSDLIKADWDQLVASIDDGWDRIDRDETVIRFFLIPDDASKGRRHYRNLVKAERDKHLQYRNRLWNDMMTIVPARAPDGQRQRRPPRN